MNIDYEKVYEGYARDNIEIAKMQMKNKLNDELKSFFDYTYPKNFLEDHGLKWKVALEKIAAAEILQERGFEISLDSEKCKSIYEGYARDEIETLKIQLESKFTNDELRELCDRSYPAGFLEEHGLKWRVALEKIAATEILNDCKKIDGSDSSVRK